MIMHKTGFLSPAPSAQARKEKLVNGIYDGCIAAMPPENRPVDPEAEKQHAAENDKITRLMDRAILRSIQTGDIAGFDNPKSDESYAEYLKRTGASHNKLAAALTTAMASLVKSGKVRYQKDDFGATLENYLVHISAQAVVRLSARR